MWIEHTIILVAGLGLIRRGTQTATGERMLRLPAFAVATLRRGKPSSDGDPVLPDSPGGRPAPSTTAQDLRNAHGSAEFARATSHAFRKTAAT